MSCIIIFALALAAVQGGRMEELTDRRLRDHTYIRISDPIDAEDFRRGATIDLNVPDDQLNVNEIAEISPAERSDKFEGDIDLNDIQKAIVARGIQSEMDDMRAATTHKWAKWLKVGKQIQVPYTLDSKYSQDERARIARAFDDFHKNTCIRLVARSNQKDYVGVFRGDGCYSSVGRQGGKQQLSLGNGCTSVGTVVHEFMHALGWWHEQSRADRDNYIKIHWNNIQQKMKYNFNKCSSCDAQGISYDTTSVMQYEDWSFASDRSKPSMTKIGCPNKLWRRGDNPSCKLGQDNGLAKTDIIELNKLYCGGVRPSCDDDPDYKDDCKFWSGEGYCEHSHVSFMEGNCKKSCGLC